MVGGVLLNGSPGCRNRCGKFHKISAGLCFPSLTLTIGHRSLTWEEQTPATGCQVKVTVTQPVSDIQEAGYRGR